MTSKDGGPAFPEVDSEMHGEHGEVLGRVYSAGGMTLRDYFAAQALPACIMRCGGDTIPPAMTREQYFAAKAYDCADEMLWLRAQKARDAS